MRSRTDEAGWAAHRAFRSWAVVLAALLAVDVALALVRGAGAVALGVQLALVVAAVGAASAHYAVRRRLQVSEQASVPTKDLAGTRARVTSVLAERSIEIALQPIVDLVTGSTVGVEALSRFRDGRPPDVWFGEAAQVGLGRDLDLLAFQSALELFRELPPAAFLSVNATPELLNDRTFHELLLRADVPSHRLVIEVTEHDRVTSYDELGEALAPLRARGVRLAVDDAGAGYASMSHVLQLRPDHVKLDRSLIADLPDDPARRALVTALVLLGLELGATLTAEGVETTTELDALAGLGVDHVQGYLLAGPTTDRGEWLRWWSRTWAASRA